MKGPCPARCETRPVIVASILVMYQFYLLSHTGLGLVGVCPPWKVCHPPFLPQILGTHHPLVWHPLGEHLVEAPTLPQDRAEHQGGPYAQQAQPHLPGGQREGESHSWAVAFTYTKGNQTFSVRTAFAVLQTTSAPRKGFEAGPQGTFLQAGCWACRSAAGREEHKGRWDAPNSHPT